MKELSYYLYLIRRGLEIVVNVLAKRNPNWELPVLKNRGWICKSHTDLHEILNEDRR